MYTDTHDLSVDYARALKRVARSMQDAGITPLTLDSSRCNAWLSSMDKGRTTKSNYRRMARTLWSFAARKKFSPSVSDDFLRVKVPAKPPIAWTADELRRLLDTCEKLTGTFSSGCQRNLFWTAWVLVGFETGLRYGDLHHLKASQLRGTRLYVTHHKTGQAQGKILSSKAADLIRQLAHRGKDGTVFRWALSRKHLFLQFKNIVKSAGLEGSTKFLRRSGATYCELKQRGSAKQFLGHLSDGLAYKCYVDPTLLEDDIPTPIPFIE